MRVRELHDYDTGLNFKTIVLADSGHARLLQAPSHQSGEPYTIWGMPGIEMQPAVTRLRGTS